MYVKICCIIYIANWHLSEEKTSVALTYFPIHHALSRVFPYYDCFMKSYGKKKGKIIKYVQLILRTGEEKDGEKCSILTFV